MPDALITLLAIDGEPMNRQSLAGCLEGQGNAVFPDLIGNQGPDAYYRQLPSPVFPDVNRPFMAGFGAIP